MSISGSMTEELKSFAYIPKKLFVSVCVYISLYICMYIYIYRYIDILVSNKVNFQVREGNANALGTEMKHEHESRAVSKH